ncbi:MAG TPA: hypothetical protein VEG25_02290, partial [Burkholderiales bacterium]|nr:hypothetical protein [Burkholderiales bacterium]
ASAEPFFAMKTTAPSVHRVELHLHDLAQLFNSMDPTPFVHKDLDPEAEEFIESWALEFPPQSRIHIAIHLEQLPTEGDPNALVNEAIHNYYDYKVGLARRGLHRLLREGRKSLVIGLSFLALCLLAANAIEELTTGTFLSIVRESLTIGGWVAMWRPLEIFLYDWWPVTRRIQLYRSLGRAQVHITHGK